MKERRPGTLDAIWDLFETSVHLNDEQERAALFDLADELAETRDLPDWSEKTRRSGAPEKRALPPCNRRS